jgi:GAF domain-containing protein
MFAVMNVMKGERSWIGAMIVGNPSGRVDRFGADDLRLLETLANNTSIALENDRLGVADAGAPGQARAPGLPRSADRSGQPDAVP